MTATEVLRAHREGQAAAAAGQPSTECPYDPDGATPQERANARMWLRGYERINPFPVDYSG